VKFRAAFVFLLPTAAIATHPNAAKRQWWADRMHATRDT
jgi:hypothetical protein